MATQRDKAGLIAETDARITTNGVNGNTGAIVNALFQDFIESLMFIDDNFIDDDSFVSASATTAPSSESVKVYADQVESNAESYADSLVRDLIDSDTMVGVTSTNVCSGESIKAYVDNTFAAAGTVTKTGTGVSNRMVAWDSDGVIKPTLGVFSFNGVTMTVNGTGGSDLTMDFLADDNYESRIRIRTVDEDAVLAFDNDGTGFALGFDHSDNSNFKMCNSSLMGTNVVLQVDSSSNLLMPSIPTSSAGLPANALWSDSGTIKIIPE